MKPTSSPVVKVAPLEKSWVISLSINVLKCQMKVPVKGTTTKENLRLINKMVNITTENGQILNINNV